MQLSCTALNISVAGISFRQGFISWTVFLVWIVHHFGMTSIKKDIFLPNWWIPQRAISLICPTISLIERIVKVRPRILQLDLHDFFVKVLDLFNLASLRWLCLQSVYQILIYIAIRDKIDYYSLRHFSATICCWCLAPLYTTRPVELA